MVEMKDEEEVHAGLREAALNFGLVAFEMSAIKAGSVGMQPGRLPCSEGSALGWMLCCGGLEIHHQF